MTASSSTNNSLKIGSLMFWILQRLRRCWFCFSRRSARTQFDVLGRRRKQIVEPSRLVKKAVDALLAQTPLQADFCTAGR